MNDLDRLREAHGPQTLIYLLCRAMGLSQRDASDRAGFTPQTGIRREQEPYWPGALEIMQARLHDADPIVQALIPDTLLAYQAALADNDKSVARDVLDRAFGKPTTRQPDAGRSSDLPPLIVYKRVADGSTHDH